MEKLPPEILLKLWQDGQPLKEACLAFCDTHIVKSYHAKLVTPKNLQPMQFYSLTLERQTAEDKLKANLAEKITRGEFIGLGFVPPVSLQDYPTIIPPHVWVAKNMHYINSLLYGDNIHYESVRIIKKGELEKALQPNEIILDVLPQHETRGRPSVEKQLFEIYENLKKRGKIDFTKNLKAHLEIIQNAFAQAFPYHNDGNVEYSAVNKHLGLQFKRDRQHYKSIK